MGKRSDISDSTVTAIIALKQRGVPHKEIAAQVECSPSTVSKVLRREGSRRSNCGRKRVTTLRDDRKLQRIVRQSRFSSVNELAQQWNKAGVESSERTCHRRLVEMGYRSRVPLEKPLLSTRQKQKRLQWCRERRYWTAEEWGKVLFSDESNFVLHFGPQGSRVWRKKGEEHHKTCLKRSVKFPQSVMVWGAICATAVSQLCFLRSTVNAAVYQDVLEHFMVPAADNMFGAVEFIFQQDSAPAHTAKTTIKWLEEHHIRVMDWPGNSPDLNPIENLWGIVKRRVRQYIPSTTDELKAVIEACWEEVSCEHCQSLIDSMPRRIAAVIEANGGPTKY